MKQFKYILVATALLCFASCSDDDDKDLKNDFIKKTVAPAIVGEKIDFAYAMGATSGILNTAEANASIAGTTGTGFELYSYYYDDVAKSDVALQTVKETSTSGSVTTATMESKIDEVYMKPYVPKGTNMVDMTAATLRYTYVVPEEARGKEVSFKFSSKSSTGATASINTPSYKISAMDMKRLINLSDNNACYVSIEDMACYTKDEVTNGNLSAKIDFVYMYQAKIDTYDYGHVFLSPATNPKYIADPNLIPANWTKNSTRMEKSIDVRDGQLKGSRPDVFIDDIDLQTLDLSSAVDYVFGMQKDNGAFMKTADGKYAAYIYANTIAGTSGDANTIISIKRLKLK